MGMTTLPMIIVMQKTPTIGRSTIAASVPAPATGWGNRKRIAMPNDPLAAIRQRHTEPIDLTHATEDIATLLATVDALTQQRDDLVSQAEDDAVEITKLKGAWPATDGSPMAIAKAKIEGLRDAVERYGQHFSGCHSQKCASIGYHPAHNPGKHECTCGLVAELGRTG